MTIAAMQFLGEYLSSLGRHDEARAMEERATSPGDDSETLGQW